ncbi:NAD-dependent epimerase/dehydratase family protein [Paenibacillus eucommiae]|uniref:Nucleoside-diphosphate-sugar epimerase n=1 Tax=Paenibacillus eucommiae TaxID=1355755 RepID=A0ABS4J1C0_9BACL|nr:NAD(P)-dependent oxidoreductase [Paenibacillus eucommiae]MBP1993115.1 nucleoside-diphosphate-sugar epimerase [Paenibacillus eucommiae]
MKRIAVTGGNGNLGAQIVNHLLEKDYEVTVLDIKERQDAVPKRNKVVTKILDLNNYHEVEHAMAGCDALIHMAAIPSPGIVEPHVLFSNNAVSTYNVLEAACKLEFQKVVLASSESAYGFPWAHRSLSPLYVPVDELHPLIPHDDYGISKAVNEITGESFFRRTGMQVVSLRLSTVSTPDIYAYFLNCLNKPEELRRILWSYIDIRDAANACVLALEKSGLGYMALNITANDTCSNIRTQELMERFFPDVTDIRTPFSGFEALYSNEKAKHILGWEIVHNWRDPC